MKHVFIVSPTLKDADGIFGIIHEMVQHEVSPSDVDITFIQPLYDGEEDNEGCFHSYYTKFRDAISEHCSYKITHSTVTISNLPDASKTWVTGTASFIEGQHEEICVFLDLGTMCENKETTALYRALRDRGLEDSCILYAPSPDSDACSQWKKDNKCQDFVVRRENVTRARAVYIPMQTRFCKALGIVEPCEG